MVNKEGEKVQVKVIHNIFNNKISQILRKRCPFRYRKPPRHQTDMTKIEPLHGVLLLKQQTQRTWKEF
jgi:hypothetical protein